ncbi:SPX domain-containing protein [Exophiala viscosa]|uniref:SPX domain-containing protein n=1 Tax=Exophiala viscosa TaxID=2486360 RepID=UPI002194A4AC|nr:SPX domain-containing protein [Exophiala viscosa]
MKFGQGFEAALARDEYPRDWIDHAISYKKLKKCIKRVQQELASLGLDKETLDALWQHVNTGGAEIDGQLGERLQYSVDGNEKLIFTPKLTIVIDPRDGSPMDAWLSPDTRRILKRLAKSEDGRRPSVASMKEMMPDDQEQHLETVEVPLTSDSEFFQILTRELSDLDHLQNSERSQLEVEIAQLGRELRALRSSRSKRSKQEIEAWRTIFELYTDAEIFMSSHEADAGARDAVHAQKQYSEFNKALAGHQNQILHLGKEGTSALDRFLRVNIKLLRLIKFQEINNTALNKILKKFDKRTALRARSSVSNTLTHSRFMAHNLAKATCFTISEELLNIIPQLNDYLCPVCFSISYKPIRLRCGHIFCIRCMVVLQREEQDRCPMCREGVVLEASSENLDKDLMKFMKSNFTAAVKAKQKENEIQAGIDRWGAQYENSQKCIVM